MEHDAQVGVLLPTADAHWGAGDDPRRIVGIAAHAEQLGFSSIWVNDTLLGARIEPLTMLAAVAPATERVTLGTAAMLPVLRRPVQTAQAIASLDLLSGGRLALAVGAGFPGRSEPEHAASEVPWASRFARLDDTVALWRRMWTADGPVSFEGDVLWFKDVPPGIRPHRAGGPPIWLAGATPKALARTGRLYDGWLPYPPDPADYAAGLADVRGAASAAGREADAIAPALFATVHIADDVETGRAAVDAFCRANYGYPLEVIGALQTVITGPAEHVEAGLARFIAAGARHLVLRIAAADLAEYGTQLEGLARTVRPGRGS